MKESDRVMPVRKRTALVDQRISRSRLSGEGLTERAQQLHQAPRPTSPNPSPVPEPTPAATIAKAPEVVAAAASAVVTPLALALGLGMPVMKEPTDDEDDVPSPRSGSVNILPPTPEPPRAPATEEGRVPDQPVPEAQDDEVLSPTAAILDQMESTGGTGEDSAIGSGLGGLRRAASGEASRLRGPRGARGPRPIPGRVPSNAGGSIASLSAVVPKEDENGQEVAKAVPTPTSVTCKFVHLGLPLELIRVAPIGDYAARRGKPSVGAGAVSGLFDSCGDADLGAVWTFYQGIC
jgi:hypothetical protein